MSQVRLSDEQDRVVVSDQTPNTILQIVDQRARLVVDQDVTKIVSVGIQGPQGPPVPIAGASGDVLFNGGLAVAADSGNFTYSVAQQALLVKKITGTVLDGGNF